MSDLEQVLDDCLGRLIEGSATVEECLAAHPEHRSQLRPLLCHAAGIIRHGREIQVSPAFKARARAKLTQHMLKHQRRSSRNTFMLWRIAISVSILVLALLSAGTVHAQGALPGDVFYVWKLASERVWRGFSADHNHVDLLLADRRVNEIVVTANDPLHQARALNDYEEILTRLQSGSDAASAEKIMITLKSNQKSLEDAGLSVPQLDDFLGPRQNDSIDSELPQLSPDVEIPVLNP